MSSSKAVPFFKKPSAKVANARKREIRPAESDHDSDSSSDDDSSSENESRSTGLASKRRKRNVGGLSDTISSNGVVKRTGGADTGSVEHKSTGSAAVSNSTDITKTSALYDEEFLLGKKSTPKEGEDQGKDNIYTGEANYKKFTQARESTTRKVGPMKASATIRSTTVTDYQPDVCKDYKQTGFCGYGDSCKFLHMREDYKAGWQLDREWEEVQRKKGKT